MMGVGWSEMMVIVVVALLVFGPRELPQVLRTVGGYMRQFRRVTNEVRREFDNALREAERQIDVEEGRPAGPAATRSKAVARERARESDAASRRSR